MVDLVVEKKVIETAFLGESVTNRSNALVMFTHAKNESERKKQSPFTKVGRIGGQTIKGWIRHAMAKLLISRGVSACHPLLGSSVTSDRNKEYFKSDLAIGYHPRGECKSEGGCIMYHMFGDLDVPANLMVTSVYFYPSTTGNSSATKNINRAFGSVGSGRCEMIKSSPRCQSSTHQTYMSIEHVAGVMIEAPFKLVLRNSNPDQEVVLRKTLQFLNDMVGNEEFDFLLGGMRTAGYGRAKVLPLVPKKRRRASNTNAQEPDEEPAESEGGDRRNYKIQFKLKRADAENLEKQFESVIAREKEKFPISNEEKSNDD